MTATPIRVATALLSERIFAGRPTKDGRGFKEPRYDVTSDVLVAIKDKVGIGNEIEVGLPGTAVEFRIAVLPPKPTTPTPVEDQSGYADAFYQIADMLGITARTASPKEVWQGEMLPKLKALIEGQPT